MQPCVLFNDKGFRESLKNDSWTFVVEKKLQMYHVKAANINVPRQWNDQQMDNVSPLK